MDTFKNFFDSFRSKEKEKSELLTNWNDSIKILSQHFTKIEKYYRMAVKCQMEFEMGNEEAIQGGHGLMYVWASGLLGIWASGHLGFWASGHLGIWASGHLGIWTSGHLGFWASGHLGFWASGHLGI